nr:hydrolase 2, exosortase A system-associated [Duganella aceris]
MPFFLAAGAGERFCLYHQPDPDVAPRGAILYVPPFAEELNKSRRMAALQSRAYARAGFGVLQIDLYGCGDSSGDFADARWDIWLSDLRLGWHWLTQRNNGPFYLWGLRLGALLALELAASTDPEGLILWQPVISGRAHLHQFARMQSAARLFGAAPQEHGAEIGGYTVAPELSDAINRLDAAALTPACSTHWLELNPAQPALQAASALLIERWREAGIAIEARALQGTSFWASAEISESAELLAATLDATLAVGRQAASTPLSLEDR